MADLKPVRSKTKATKAQMLERMETVEKMLRRCLAHGTVVRTCAPKWDVSPRTVRSYIARVHRQWDKDADEFAEKRFIQRQSQIEGVLEMCMRQEPPNLRVAMIALDRLCRLEGNYPVEQVAVDLHATVGVGIGLATLGFNSAEEVRGRISELRERLMNGGPISAGYLPAKPNGKGNGKANGGGNGRADGDPSS